MGSKFEADEGCDMRGMGTRGKNDSILVGVGAGIAIIVIVLLQSLVGVSLTSTMTVTSTTTVIGSTIPDAYEQVVGANAFHLLLLDSRNVSGLVSGFDGNATLVWIGGPTPINNTSLPALHGYRLAVIDTVMKDFTGDFLNFSLSNESQTVGAVGGHWVVNSTFIFYGYNPVAGNINGTVAAQDSYVHVGNEWLIAQEIWNFTQYQQQHYIFT
jgi:hypothetical protein